MTTHLPTPTQPALPGPLSVPDHLRVIGPMTLPDRDRRAEADKVMHERRDAVIRQVQEGRR